MRLLFIAPLPPPITGHSIVSKILLGYLKHEYVVDVINLSERSKHDGSFTIGRALAVLKAISKVFHTSKHVDRIYLTLSESVLGNLKDLLMLLLIGSAISRTVLHLHGGSFRQHVIEYSPFIYFMNRHFINQARAVIISGSSHKSIFHDLISSSKVNVVPNFAPASMFISTQQVIKKFFDFDGVLRVLYVSSMTSGKGCLNLLAAYEQLSEFVKARIRIDFAGAFSCPDEKKAFIERIRIHTNLFYHGVISSEVKNTLFSTAHIFCLPTLLMEGQPISILEAYASGCVVLTTSQLGILDIFVPSENGYLVSAENPSSFACLLESLLFQLDDLREIALNNNKQADMLFREQLFADSISSILDNSRSNSFVSKFKADV